MISRLELAQQRSRNRRHAGGGCARIFRTFHQAHAFFQHVIGRVGVSGVDETRVFTLEPRFSRLGAVIDKALRQKDCFRSLAKPGAAGAAVHELGGGAKLSVACHDPGPTHKNTGLRSRQPVLQPDHFSDLFNVAASRSAKSPRDNGAFKVLCRLRQSLRLVIKASGKLEHADLGRGYSLGQRDSGAL